MVGGCRWSGSCVGGWSVSCVDLSLLVGGEAVLGVGKSVMCCVSVGGVWRLVAVTGFMCCRAGVLCIGWVGVSGGVASEVDMGESWMVGVVGWGDDGVRGSSEVVDMDESESVSESSWSESWVLMRRWCCLVWWRCRFLIVFFALSAFLRFSWVLC